MKRNNHQPSARPQYIETVNKKTLQMVELLIHRDTQSLKHLGGRVMIAPPAAFCTLDQARQLVCALDGPLPALGNNSFGDPPRLRLLAIVTENPCQFFRRRCVDEAMSVERLPAVHAHVQSPAQAKTKSTLRGIDLP